MVDKFDKIHGLTARLDMIKALAEGLKWLGSTLKSISKNRIKDNKKVNMEVKSTEDDLKVDFVPSITPVSIESVGLQNNTVEVKSVSQYTNNDNNKVNIEDKSTKDDVKVDFVPSITPLSIESGGINNNTVEVKVEFMSETNCAMKWNVCYKNGGFQSLVGENDEVMLHGKRRYCVNNIKFLDVENLEEITFVIYGHQENVHMLFNVPSLHKAGAEPLEKFKYNILKYHPTVVIDKNKAKLKGIETLVEVSPNVVDRMRDRYPYTATAMFSFTKTTVITDTVVKPRGVSNRYIEVKVKEGSENELVVRVGQKSARFKGDIHLMMMQGTTAFLHEHLYVVNIRVIHEGSYDNVPAVEFAVKRNIYVEFLRGKSSYSRDLDPSALVHNMIMYKVRSIGRLKGLSKTLDNFDDNDNIYCSQEVDFGPEDTKKVAENTISLLVVGVWSGTKRSSLFIKGRSNTDPDTIRTELVGNHTIIPCRDIGLPPALWMF